MQRHLNQARAAEGVLDKARSKGSRAIAEGGCRRRHGRNCALPLATESGTCLKIRTEARIQADVVVRRIETGMVEKVEELRVIAKSETFVQLKEFEDAEVETRLKWAPE
jgi:hypothetical protein